MQYTRLSCQTDYLSWMKNAKEEEFDGQQSIDVTLEDDEIHPFGRLTQESTWAKTGQVLEGIDLNTITRKR